MRVHRLAAGAPEPRHPKLYLARRGDRVSAIVGSANLTTGLVANGRLATDAHVSV